MRLKKGGLTDETQESQGERKTRVKKKNGTLETYDFILKTAILNFVFPQGEKTVWSM